MKSRERLFKDCNTKNYIQEYLHIPLINKYFYFFYGEEKAIANKLNLMFPDMDFNDKMTAQQITLTNETLGEKVYIIRMRKLLDRQVIPLICHESIHLSAEVMVETGHDLTNIHYNSELMATVAQNITGVCYDVYKKFNKRK